jgi:Ser/Thr protein kinase RdoA (MazF antagonist)
LLGGLEAYAATGNTGLIHADVLRENVLVNKSSLSLIDFDDSGFGLRPYDLGTVLSQNLYEPAYPEIRAALIEGYADPALTPDLVDLFTLARVCASVGWAAPRLPHHDPVHKSHLARAEMLARRLLG